MSRLPVEGGADGQPGRQALDDQAIERQAVHQILVLIHPEAGLLVQPPGARMGITQLLDDGGGDAWLDEAIIPCG